jgi:D-alanyl-D-alanine carboxypeptidase
MLFKRSKKEGFEEPSERTGGGAPTPFFKRQVPGILFYPLLILSLGIIGLFAFAYFGLERQTNIVLQDGGHLKTDFVYGSWPVLQNADFFKKTKEDFIVQRVSFVEADLSAMIIRFYKDGELVREMPIRTKGRDGSWWETPAGLYRVIAKEENHFSSFGRVYMPYSMQFQGNFFIHGPTRYPDGTPTSATYSGGCIRLALEDAKELYRLVGKGTPVLVFEESFNGSGEPVRYASRYLLPENISYLAADLSSNFVFAENNAVSQRPLGSITQLVSALVAVEYINVEREVTVSVSMLASTTVPRLKAGDRVSILDLLSLLLMESSNEAAAALTPPLGEGQFVNLMNLKAHAIGMNQSVFTDPAGTSPTNMSTAEDLVQLAKYLYFNRSFVLDMSMGNENRTAYSPMRYWNIRNLNIIPGISTMVGGKCALDPLGGTGMLAVFETDISGHKLPLVIAVMGSEDPRSDILSLLQYVKSNFKLEPIPPPSL